MRISGRWEPDEEGTLRPVISCGVDTAAATVENLLFLVDPGADRTVFSHALWDILGRPAPLPEESLSGVGGGVSFAVVRAMVMMPQDGGGFARITGPFAVFTEPDGMDCSILGRDIINNFDLILSYRRREVLLLAPPHEAVVGGG